MSKSTRRGFFGMLAGGLAAVCGVKAAEPKLKLMKFGTGKRMKTILLVEGQGNTAILRMAPGQGKIRTVNASGFATHGVLVKG